MILIMARMMRKQNLLQHAKYSMIGSLHFYYISDNQNYECKKYWISC